MRTPNIDQLAARGTLFTHAFATVSSHIVADESFPFDAELAPEQPGNRDVAFMADEAPRFMDADPEKAFFLVVGYSDPHRAPQNFGNTREWPKVPRQRYAPSQVIVPHLPDVLEVRQDLAHYY